MANPNEVLSELFSEISAFDRTAIGSELNIDVVASISQQGNMAMKPDPAILGALFRRIDPTDEQILQLVEGHIFEIGFDPIEEVDFEVIVRFDSPRSRDGALPLTDIIIASLTLNALLKSIVSAHRPLGVDLEMPLVVVFTGSVDITPKCKRAIAVGLMLVIGLGQAVEKVVKPTIEAAESYKKSQAIIGNINADTNVKVEQAKTEQGKQVIEKKGYCSAS